MPHQPHLNLAISYLDLAVDELFADDHDPASSALFIGVEALEIQNRLTEFDPDGATVVAAASPADALALAADLLCRDGRAELVVLAQRLGRLAQEVR